MQLDEFVKTSLEQLIGGVAEAQKSATDSGATINPGFRTPKSGEVASNGSVIREVEFDVVVTVSEETGSKAGLRVGLAGIGAGLEGKSGRGESAVSRIRFSVPVVLPVPPR